MLDLILSFIPGGSLTAILAGIGMLLTLIGGAYFKGDRNGARKERAKQAEERLKAREVADEVDNDVGAMPPDEARKELGKWSS